MTQGLIFSLAATHTAFHGRGTQLAILEATIVLLLLLAFSVYMIVRQPFKEEEKLWKLPTKVLAMATTASATWLRLASIKS